MVSNVLEETVNGQVLQDPCGENLNAFRETHDCPV
jgi:hypothetical protein